MTDKPKQVQKQTQELRRLVATEASIFDDLRGKRVAVVGPGYTGVLSRHGLDFIELKEVRDYGQVNAESLLRKVTEWEINHGYRAFGLERLRLDYRSKIVNKGKIDEIYALDDIISRE